jgi:hypothetical protein
VKSYKVKSRGWVSQPNNKRSVIVIAKTEGLKQSKKSKVESCKVKNRGWVSQPNNKKRHCEERSDEAIRKQTKLNNE